MSKIHIKLGSIEIEFDGSEEFIRDDLLNLITTVSTIKLDVSEPTTKENPAAPSSSTKPSHNGLTVAAIAKYLNVQTASELIIASLAKLTVYDGAEDVNRKDLLSCMKLATGYYKSSFSKNLTASLETVVKQDKVRSPRKDRYTLSPNTKSEVQNKLTHVN